MKNLKGFYNINFHIGLFFTNYDYKVTDKVSIGLYFTLYTYYLL